MKMLTKEYVVVRKIDNVVVSSSRGRCDAGLTSTWFETALLDVNGLTDLPDISMNVTECHCGFLHLYLKRGVARVAKPV